MTALPLLEATGVPVEENLPTSTLYLVAAFAKTGGYWKIWTRLHPTPELAANSACDLSGYWTGAHIIKVTLPQEKP